MRVRSHSRASSGRSVASASSTGTRRCGRGQCGHPLGACCFVRLFTLARHSWRPSRSQRHHTARDAPLATSCGVRVPFRDGCHSAATPGAYSANEFSGASGRSPRSRLEHDGHPALLPARFETIARQTCPLAQRQATLRPEPRVTSLGVSFPFAVGCQSRASSGIRVARQFVMLDFFPWQKGQRLPRCVRLRGTVRHWWSGPFGHSHQIGRPERNIERKNEAVLCRMPFAGERGEAREPLLV